MNSPGILLNLNFKQLFFKGIRYDRKVIDDAIQHLANFLLKNCYSSSPFILLAAYNHIKTIIAYYAILKAGKIAVIIDPACRPIELTEIIEDVDPAAILLLNNNTLTFNYEEEIVFRRLSKSFVIHSDLTDVCTIVFTNAEDGFSKGAMLTEKNLLAEITDIIKINHLNQSTVTLALLPLCHLFGLVQGALIATHSGGTAVISEINILKITDIIADISNYKVTHVYSIPSIYYLLGKCPGAKVLLSQVKILISGGTKLTPFVYDSFYRNTGHKIREGYGLTESSPACTLNNIDEDPVFGSVGKPIAGSEIRITDALGKECQPDEEGEICVKGDLVFKGYFNHEKITSATIKDGWLYTGDYGKKDKQGFIYFTGLKKDMINVAGNNVYPKKLERLMKINKNASSVKIYSEDSVLQGQIVGSVIKLIDSSTKAQLDYKKWCFDNINNTILPKIWLFE